MERTWTEVIVRRLTYGDTPSRELRNYAGRLRMSDMITALVEDRERTARVAAELVALRSAGRRVLALSERVGHLHSLRDAMLAARPDLADHVGVMTGATADRGEQAARPLLLATYPLCRQGFDRPELDTLVMLTPITAIEQSVGRVLRAHPNKQTPMVVDIVDPYSVFMGERNKRARQYDQLGYTVSDAGLAA